MIWNWEENFIADSKRLASFLSWLEERKTMKLAELCVVGKKRMVVEHAMLDEQSICGFGKNLNVENEDFVVGLDFLWFEENLVVDPEAVVVVLKIFIFGKKNLNVEYEKFLVGLNLSGLEEKL